MLSEHSKIYGLFRRGIYELFCTKNTGYRNVSSWSEATELAQSTPDIYQIFDSGKIKTIFTSEYRFNVLNSEDPRIYEGFLISLKAISRMHERAKINNIRLLVVLIPTKESTFSGLWNKYPDKYKQLIESEKGFWRSTKSFLDANKIDYVDTLPSLQGELARGIQPYFVDADGHPNKSGHQAIAESIAEHLITMQVH